MCTIDNITKNREFVYSSIDVTKEKVDENKPSMFKAQVKYQVSGTSESEDLVFITIC